MGFFTETLNFIGCPSLTAMAGSPGGVALASTNGTVNMYFTATGGAVPNGSFTMPTGRYVVAMGFFYPFDTTELIGAYDQTGAGYVLDYSDGNPATAGTGNFLSTGQKANTFAVDQLNVRGLAKSSAGYIAQLNAGGSNAKVPLTGVTVTTPILCITYDGTSKYYAGGGDGNIYVLDYAGAISNTITLPTTPNMGVAPQLTVNSLSMIGTSTLIVGTVQGMIFVYSVSGSPTVIDTYWMGSGGAPSPLFSNSANGLVLQSFEGVGQNGAHVSLVDYGMAPYMQVDELSLDTTSNIVDMYLDSSIGAALIGIQNGVVIYGCDGLVTSSAPTRAISSANADVAQRIYRVINPKEFRGRVELDEDIASGFQTASLRFQNIQYSEISSTGSGPEDLDIRRFP